MIACERKVTVIEFACTPFHNDAYGQLSAALGHDYLLETETTTAFMGSYVMTSLRADAIVAAASRLVTAANISVAASKKPTVGAKSLTSTNVTTATITAGSNETNQTIDSAKSTQIIDSAESTQMIGSSMTGNTATTTTAPRTTAPTTKKPTTTAPPTLKAVPVSSYSDYLHRKVQKLFGKVLFRGTVDRYGTPRPPDPNLPPLYLIGIITFL